MVAIPTQWMEIRGNVVNGPLTILGNLTVGSSADPDRNLRIYVADNPVSATPNIIGNSASFSGSITTRGLLFVKHKFTGDYSLLSRLSAIMVNACIDTTVNTTNCEGHAIWGKLLTAGTHDFGLVMSGLRGDFDHYSTGRVEYPYGIYLGISIRAGSASNCVLIGGSSGPHLVQVDRAWLINPDYSSTGAGPIVDICGLSLPDVDRNSTNKVNIYLGRSTANQFVIPSGVWNIYSVSTRLSYFAGPIQLVGDGNYIQAPVMTTANRPATPATGMIIFDSTVGKHMGYDGANWQAFW
jgi:hypothetical protein